MKKRLILTDPKTVIRDPATRLRVPLEGIDTDPRMDFWRRRIREGSMIDSGDVPTKPKRGHIGTTPAVGVDDADRDVKPGDTGAFPVEPAPKLAKPRHFLNEPPKA